MEGPAVSFSRPSSDPGGDQLFGLSGKERIHRGEHGRAAPANPWIFRQIAQYTAFGSYDHPTPMDRYHMIRDYFLMLMEEDEPAAISGRMKQFASWFTHGVPGGAILRKSIYEAKSGEAVLSAVDAFFASQPEQLVAAGA